MFRIPLAICVGVALLCVPLVSQSFSDVTVASGISVMPYGFTSGSYLPTGRGCAWDDFDGDGDQDVFIAGGPARDYTLWWNNAGVFTQQILQSGTGGAVHDHQVVAADFDNDGDPDIYVVRGEFAPNLLFVNMGGGVFSEEASARGIADAGDGYAASFGDIDRDGHLDLYVGNYMNPDLSPAANVLYRNLGNGTFADVTAASGAFGLGHTLAVLMCDVDDDGWIDIIVGNDKGNFVLPASLYRNNRNGTLTDVATAWNANMATDVMGITVGDIDNDEFFDLFTTDIPGAHTLLMWDSNARTFAAQASWDQTASAWGLSSASDGWSCFFADFDHDSRPDIFYTQTGGSGVLMRNSGQPLSDISAFSGISTVCPPCYSSSLVDFDDDGDLDIFLPGDGIPARLLQNNLSSSNHYLQVELEGTTSNRDGIGASVRVRHGLTLSRRIRLSGEGYLSDGDSRLHFGLADATMVDEIEVRWPSGTVQYLSQVAVDQVIQITEPRFAISGTLAPGTANSVTLTLPDDAFIPYVCGLSANVFSQFDLPDGRAVLVDINDPLLALTTIPGNSGFVNSVGAFSPQGIASMTLNIPPIPALSGFTSWMIGVSWNPAYPSNIKSIVGPQKITIP
jgi:enediyne biosynthesis protein E4